jgi:hypothetical protein
VIFILLSALTTQFYARVDRFVRRRPVLFEVFGDQSAVAVVRRFLTAKQTSAVQEFARGVFDVPGTHQIEKLALLHGPAIRRGEKQAEPPAPHPEINTYKH